MKDLRSSRRLFQKWHRRDKATIDHLLSTVCKGEPAARGTLHSPMTATGLTVEEQVRKAWVPCRVGLPIF